MTRSVATDARLEHHSMTTLLLIGSIRWLGLLPLLDWNAKEIMDATRLRRNQKATPKKNVPKNPTVAETIKTPPGNGWAALPTSRAVSTMVGDPNADTMITSLAAAIRNGSE